MTLGEIKKRVFALIEEISDNTSYYTDDQDYQKKINYVIDTYQNELARIKRLADYDETTVKKGDIINLYEEYPQFYKLKSIKGVTYDVFENIVTFKEDGNATIYYYKYPKKITDDTANDFKLEISQDVCEILIYGVAADLLKADVSAQYGQVYANAYENALKKLDMDVSASTYEIEGGYDV